MYKRQVLDDVVVQVAWQRAGHVLHLEVARRLARRQLAHLLAQQIELLLLAPHRAVELVEQVLGEGAITILDPDEIDDDLFVIPTAQMGAPTVMVEKIPAGTEPTLSLRTLEEHLGRKAEATMPIEGGGSNSMIPLLVAAETGLPVVDADGQLLGIVTGMLLPRFTTVMGTSLLGVLLLGIGIGVMLWRYQPNLWSQLSSRPDWYVIGAGVLLIGAAWKQLRPGKLKLAAPPPAARISGLMNLGTGTAFDIDSPQMVALHGLIAQRLQGLPQHIGQAGGFAHQRLQFGKDGVGLVSLKLHLVTHPFAGEQTDVAQRVQLFFKGTRSGLRLAGQLAQVHFLVRLHEQQG